MIIAVAATHEPWHGISDGKNVDVADGCAPEIATRFPENIGSMTAILIACCWRPAR